LTFEERRITTKRTKGTKIFVFFVVEQ